MITKTLKNFDIRQIDRSGQCFRMEELSDGAYAVIAADKYVEVRQDGERCTFSCGEEEFDAFWRRYFDLDTDYREYILQIDENDPYLTDAAKRGAGIRILRQEFWEMIVTFLISQRNTIVRIRRSVRSICERYGERRTAPGGQEYFVFPAPEVLAAATDREMQECGLGYRGQYVLGTSRTVAGGGIDLDTVSRMPYAEAYAELLKLYGVGEKVADCICLFGLHHLEAFPVDTHIRQAMKRNYPNGFPYQRYRGIEGVIQQYIFYRELLRREEA